MLATSDVPTNNLASLIVLLQKLYEQLTTDRQHWAHTGKDMVALITTLETQLQTFKSLQPDFKMHVTTLMRDEAQQAAHTAATSLQKSLTQTLAQDLNPMLQPLAQAAEEAQHQLKEQRQTLQYYFWWFILGIIISSVLGGLIVRYGLQPQFLDYERRLMWQGYALQTAQQNPDWHERDRILEPYLGKRLAPPQPEPSQKVKTKSVPKS